MKTAQSCEWTADGWNSCNVAAVIYVPAVAISALFADKSAKTLFAVLSKLQIILVNYELERPTILQISLSNIHCVIALNLKIVCVLCLFFLVNKVNFDRTIKSFST